jgi:hypothetical protein
MFQLLLIVLSFLLSHGRSAKPVDCYRYKDGKFVLDTGDGVRYIIERNGTTQTEFKVNSDTVMIFEVTWKSPCEYQLQQRFSKIKIRGSKERTEIKEFKSGPLIDVKILEVGNKSYYFSSRAPRVLYSVTRIQ